MQSHRRPSSPGRTIATLRRFFLTAFCIALLSAPHLHAQQSNGTITGLVTDAKNNVVPGAKITISNDDGSFKTETLTSQTGNYTVPSLPPGNYTIHIEKGGFQEEEIQQVPVTIGGVATADATLKVGRLSETITVTAANTLLSASSPTLTTTIDQEMTVELPFAERTTLGVAMFAPGVTGDPAAADGVGSEIPNAYTGPIDPGAGLAIVGSRPGSVSQLVDGSDLLLTSYPRAGVTFSSDTIKSVTVQSAGMAAQYGRTGGGIINQASAGGGDRYHGDLRWRHREPIFEVVTPGSGGAPPAEHLNLYTIAFNGPIPTPFWKHHMYFLVSDEPLRDTNINYGRQRFLTPDEIAGRFYNSYDELNTTILRSQGYAAAVAAARTGGQFMQFPTNAQGFPCGAANQGGQCGTLADPCAVSPGNCNLGHNTNINQAVHFPNDDLSALQAQNPITQFLFNNLPLPGTSKYARFDNPQATYATDGYNGYSGRGVLTVDNRYTYRIDVNPTDRDRVFFRFTTTPVSGHRYDYHGLDSVLNNIPGESVHSENFALNYVRVLNANTVNEARATYLEANDFTYPTQITATKDWNVAIGLPPTLAGYGFSSFAFGNNVLQDGETGAGSVLNQNYGFGDDLSYIHGRHSFRFGVNYRAMQLDQAVRNSQYGGAFGSTSGLDGGPGLSGSSTAAYIMGEFGAYTVAAPKTYYYRWKYGAAYAQDDWRILPRLTLNYGLRWNVETPRMEKFNYQGSFTPNGAGIINGYGVTGGFAYSGTNGLGTTLWPVNYHGFEPRIGFAYQAARFMTVRASYTLVHAPLTGLGINIAPNLTSASSANTGTNGIGGTNAAYYVNLISNPIAASPNPGTPVRSSALIESWNGTTYLPYVRDQTTAVPYAQIRSLSLQFQPAKHTLIEVNYVGNKGTHLYSTPVPTNEVPLGDANTPNTVLWDIATHQQLTAASKTGDCCGNSTTLLQRQRPFPQFNGNPIYSAYDRYASSNYNAFYLVGRQQAGFGITFIGSFSWSKSMDDASSSNGAPGDTAADTYGFANPQGYTTRGDYSLSEYDIPLHASTGYVWALPIGRGKHFFSNAPRWTDQIIGGWTTSGTQIFQSGWPLFIVASSSGTNAGFFCSTAAQVTSGTPQTICGNGYAYSDLYLRPNRVPGVNPINPNWKKDPGGLYNGATGGYLNHTMPANNYYQIGAFSLPGTYDPSTNYTSPAVGNGRRSYGDIRNPRIIYWNASIRKHFVIKPNKVNMELWADIPNILNHANYLMIGNRYTNQGLFTGNIVNVQTQPAPAPAIYSEQANPNFGDTNGGGGTRQINLGIAITF